MSHSRRHCRNQRWIVLWAIVALLLNQVVAASHFCLPGAGVGPDDAETRISSSGEPAHPFAGTGATDSHASHPCTHAMPPGDNICTVHCTHAADGNQQGKAPSTAPLHGHGPPFWTALPDRHAATPRYGGCAHPFRKADQRRLYEFCTLLI